jgi:uncharacterized protein YqiB (DUF1249 family)
MQAPRYPWALQCITRGRPTVGDLMEMCEENYLALRRLAPDLKHLRGEFISRRAGRLELHLEIIEQSPFTSLLRLTYFFPHGDVEVHRIPEADPDALLRAYHDAAQVEVVNLRQTALPIHSHYRYPALEAKWKANLFLSKWLGYCLGQGHRFAVARAHTEYGGGERLSRTL